MSNLMALKARGERTSMRGDTAATKQSQQPQNKDPEDVTPGPQEETGENTSPPLKMRLPKGITPKASGATVHHLASGHHVKNADGSTSFHMHALDGEPVSADNMEPSEGGDEMGTSGDPYGVATALKGMSA